MSTPTSQPSASETIERLKSALLRLMLTDEMDGDLTGESADAYENGRQALIAAGAAS